MRCQLALSGLACAALLALSSVAAAQDVYVAGPVEKVDLANSKIVVLGQDVAVSRAQVNRLLTARSEMSGATLQVVVVGEASQGRMLARRLIIDDTPYVPGASPVALLGYVTKVNATVGTATIGRLTVDVTALGQRVYVNDLIEIGGTQPALSGALLAAEFRRVPAGSIGSGTAGSIGSGTAGSIGSGTAGSIGSGMSGSIGSGTAGSIGSGTAGSIGSGTSGSIGSGMSGSIGSGTAGSIGSGTAGSIGSGSL